MKDRMARLRIEARDLMELVLLPGLAAVLPWRLCFKVFKLLARCSFLYKAQCDAALAQAKARGWATHDSDWLAARRLVTLVDHADYYLARTRSDAWLKSHVLVDGRWPSPGEAALLCTFHWGAGMWGLRHVSASGLKAHALVAPLNGAHFAGRTVLHRYAQARTACVAQALQCPTLDVSASLRPVLRALRSKEQVLAAIDVPSDQVSSSESIPFLGMRARVPRALLRLAVDQGVPVTMFLTGIRMADGKRFIRIRAHGAHEEVETLIRDLFADLEAAIVENPPAWHFWSEAERFFERID